MNHLSRSTALKTAALLSFLISAFSVFVSIPFFMQGAEIVDANPDAPSFVVLMIGLIIGLVGIVAALGTWKEQGWGIGLTILINAYNGLVAAPGILFAPQTWLFIASIVTVPIAIAIIVLCLWRDRQPVTA